MKNNTRSKRPNSGTGVEEYELSFTGKTYQNQKKRRKQFLTKIKRLMKTGNKKKVNPGTFKNNFLQHTKRKLLHQKNQRLITHIYKLQQM